MPIIKIPTEIASSDSILRALYRIAADTSWNLDKENDQWIVDLCPNEGSNAAQVEKIFKEHVIDYALREKVRAETSQVRALLMAHAFSGVIPQP